MEDCDSSSHCSHESLKCVKTTTHLLIDDNWTSHENLTSYDCFCPKGIVHIIIFFSSTKILYFGSLKFLKTLIKKLTFCSNTKLW